MNAYKKIYGPYKRDNKGKVIDGLWTRPEFEYLLDNQWEFTEKIDGTNIRVMVRGGEVSFGGRSEKAEIPGYLLEVLKRDFAYAPFYDVFGEKDVCLYGEGFGGKIQAGHLYGDVQFALFDVKIGNFFLSQENVIDVAHKLGIQYSPVVFRGTLRNAITVVKNNKFKSSFGDKEAEGWVGKPNVTLYDSHGERLVIKLKTVDLYGL